MSGFRRTGYELYCTVCICSWITHIWYRQKLKCLYFISDILARDSQRLNSDFDSQNLLLTCACLRFVWRNWKYFAFYALLFVAVPIAFNSDEERITVDFWRARIQMRGADVCSLIRHSLRREKHVLEKQSFVQWRMWQASWTLTHYGQEGWIEIKCVGLELRVLWKWAESPTDTGLLSISI